MTNFKLTDENGVEWVKVDSAVFELAAMVTTHRTSFAIEGSNGVVTRHYYVRRDDLPKPKGRFEEMAERFIHGVGNNRVRFLRPDNSMGFIVDHPLQGIHRDWFIAHARKIDADATERAVSAERKFLLDTRQSHVVRDSPLWDRLSNRVYELSKP